jgi:hypothetical protein
VIQRPTEDSEGTTVADTLEGRAHEHEDTNLDDTTPEQPGVTGENVSPVSAKVNMLQCDYCKGWGIEEEENCPSVIHQEVCSRYDRVWPCYWQSKQKKTRVRSAMKDNTTNPSSLVDWSRLIGDNKEEEEEEISF